jgi:uncharacterized membrane protein
MPGSLFPLLLVTHVTLALLLIVPSFLLPFTLRAGRRRRAGQGRPGALVQLLWWLERDGTSVVAVGVALSGLALLSVLGLSFAQQPWLLIALAIYTGVLSTAFFIQRPGLRRLLRRPGVESPEEDERWRRWARRQRYVSYLMAAAVGFIGWLMMAKPGA